ncbi:hypothetical protein HOY80DRAFT_953533 [Tuber brumale]|nr:hypothetical protein HOY80DRAFT_953533 [Tuber brumale]
MEKRWDEYAVSLEDFGEAVMRDSVEADAGRAIKEVKAGIVVRDGDVIPPTAKEDTTTTKLEEGITLSTMEPERATTLVAEVKKPSEKKKRKGVIEDLSSPPLESPSLPAQPWSVPSSMPPSRSISSEPRLRRSKRDDPTKPERKKKKRKKRDEIDDLFAGL